MTESRVALVTGVSRRGQIAPAIVTRLVDAGLTVVTTGWPAHDDEMPWGSSAVDVPEGVTHHRDDFADPAVPAAVVNRVIEDYGRLDVVVATHARSSAGGLADVDAAELDRCWAVNVRSVILLAQRFAEVHEPAPDGESPLGRMLWFTSGQHLGPMHGELAYAVSKGALHQLTHTLDRSLSASRIVANCINPGPVDTGYATEEFRDVLAGRFPDGRWGHPDDVADLVEFLVSESGGWMRGQVLNTEGGFDRFG